MLRRLDLRGTGTDDLRFRLPRPPAQAEPPVDEVRAVLDQVREEGDAALRSLTERFDGARIDDLRVPPDDVRAAPGRIPDRLRAALEAAHANIAAYHAAQRRPELVHRNGSIEIRELVRPVDRAGCYVPSAAAPLVSTALMTVVPARVAGVPEVVLVTAPGSDGAVDPGILAAAALAGVDEVYRVGGPAAIGALAYGTESIHPVDVIVGPGSARVAQAKREVAGRGLVGVPSSFAGPSEVVVVADASTPPEHAAIDVLVQAEHGPDGLAWLIAWDASVVDAVCEAVDRLVPLSPRRRHLEATLAAGGYAVLTDGPTQAMAVANAIAPEHLELLVEGAEALLPLVRHAGAVFCGPLAPASIGDYLAGANHVLPTYGSARFAGALRVDDFCKHIHAVVVPPDGLAQVAPHVEALADYEGLPAHAESVRIRLPEHGHEPAVRTTPPRGGVRGSGRTAGMTPPPRDDLALLGGYHSPQVDVSVRLNANEAPEPPPEAFRRQLAEALASVEWHRYPDRSYRGLREAIAKHHGAAPEQVFAANGSNEVLQTLLLSYGGPGRRAAVFEPTYALHSHIARITGTDVAVGERTDALALDLGEVRRVLGHAQPAITFLCSPNNPTGMIEPEAVVRAVASEAPGLVVVDEAYGQFAPWSALELVDGVRPLVVTRTFSKTWSMAAARLGYLIGPAWLVAELDKVALPYHLDVVKQVAGRLALSFEDEMRARVASLVEERGRVAAALAELPVDVWPSGANFVLFRPRERDGTAVWQALLDRSVLIRNCVSWPRLDGCLRVTIGTPAEDDAFLAALTEVLG
jgi:histidinol-phosphate aminotransferase